MLFGYLVDRTGNYVLPVTLCAVLMVFALLPLAMLLGAQRQTRDAIARQDLER
jgi:cyanate permease